MRRLNDTDNCGRTQFNRNLQTLENRKWLIRKICYNLMKLDTRFDKKATYKKISMLYTCHFEYVQELIFQKIAKNI